jgi:hypothetical protein
MEDIGNDKVAIGSLECKILLILKTILYLMYSLNWCKRCRWEAGDVLTLDRFTKRKKAQSLVKREKRSYRKCAEVNDVPLCKVTRCAYCRVFSKYKKRKQIWFEFDCKEITALVVNLICEKNSFYYLSWHEESLKLRQLDSWLFT